MARLRLDVDNIEIRPEGFAPQWNGRKHFAELLRARACVLSSQERALLQMYLENGAKTSQIAKLAGVSEAGVAKRLRKIKEKVTSGPYVRFLCSGREFTVTEEALARDYFIVGLSQVDIARKRGLGIYQVRKILKRIIRLGNARPGCRGR